MKFKIHIHRLTYTYSPTHLEWHDAVWQTAKKLQALTCPAWDRSYSEHWIALRNKMWKIDNRIK